MMDGKSFSLRMVVFRLTFPSNYMNHLVITSNMTLKKNRQVSIFL